MKNIPVFEIDKPRLRLQDEEVVGGDIPIGGYIISFLKRNNMFRVVGKVDLYHERAEEGGSSVPDAIMKRAREQMYAIARDYAQRKARKETKKNPQPQLL